MHLNAVTPPAPGFDASALVQSAAQAYAVFENARASRKLTNLQLARIKAGLEPAPYTVADVAQPVQARVGLDDGTKRLVMYGVAGIVGLMLFNMLQRGR